MRSRGSGDKLQSDGTDALGETHVDDGHAHESNEAHGHSLPSSLSGRPSNA